MKASIIKILVIVTIVTTAIGLRGYAANVIYIDFDEPVYLNAALKYANYIRAGKLNWLAWETINYEHPVFFKIVYGVALLGHPPVDQLVKADFDSSKPIQDAPARSLGMVGRYVSAFFSSATVLVLAILNPLAGLALAIDTLAVRYSAGIYLESLPMLATLLSALTFMVWFEKEQRRPSYHNWIWLGLAALFGGMAMASKYIYAVTGLSIGLHLFLMIATRKVKPRYLLYLCLFGIALLIAFFVFDPYLWPHPWSRLVQSLNFHVGFSQSDNVTRYDYPLWQALTWLTAPISSLIPVTGPALLVRLDQVILFFAVIGLPRLIKERPLFFIWLVLGVITLLAWPVKWPHYTMIILVPFCLSAGLGAGWFFRGVGRWMGRIISPAKAPTGPASLPPLSS